MDMSFGLLSTAADWQSDKQQKLCLSAVQRRFLRQRILIAGKIQQQGVAGLEVSQKDGYTATKTRNNIMWNVMDSLKEYVLMRNIAGAIDGSAGKGLDSLVITN